MAQSNSLMSLPRELRDIIYTQVFDFSHTINKTNTKQWQIRRNTSQPLNIGLIPISFNWLDLMRTNGRVADEMRQLYNIPAYHKDAAHQTWHAELTLNNDKFTLMWTNLPCPSSCVRHLDIDFKVNFTLAKFGHWDNDAEGQPGSIFNSLFQLLNQIVHRGPNFVVADTLPHPISFETLRLNISFPDEEKPYLRPSGPESIYILEYGKRRIFGRLVENIVAAAGNGLLAQRVGKVEICGPKSLGWPKTDINVSEEDQGDEKAVQKWREAGLVWGVDVDDTCIAV